MKLILLLAAIYSLIFYQQQKIERSKASWPSAKGMVRVVTAHQSPGLNTQKRHPSLYWNTYDEPRHYTAGKFQMASFILRAN
ncbi:MAG: hypothetical protein WDO16_03715 [Bacteroidota bacterium]